MIWNLPPLPSAQAPTMTEMLLAEWEHQHSPARTHDYQRARYCFLQQFQLFNFITNPTINVNVDAEDVRSVLNHSATICIGSATATGTHRAGRVAQDALYNARLQQLGPEPTSPASRVLLAITSSPTAELEMDELTDITEYIQQAAAYNAEVIFGHGLNYKQASELQLHLLLGYGLSLTSA